MIYQHTTNKNGLPGEVDVYNVITIGQKIPKPTLTGGVKTKRGFDNQ